MNTSVSYNCQVCNDTKWIIKNDVAIDRCGCLKNSIRDDMLKDSLLNETLKDKSFNNYHPKTEAEEKMHDIAIEYALIFKDIRKNRNNGMALLGTFGIGKTHLLAAVTKNLVSKGHKVLFVNTTAFMKDLRDLISQGKSFSERLDKLKNCEVLVLDDIAKEKVTDWVREQYYYILDHRYCTGKPVLISSNLNPTTLEDTLGGATTSRLFAMCKGRMVYVKADDYRMIEQ